MDADLAYAVERLEVLAAGLRARGWAATVAVPRDRWPSVRVVNPRMTALNEDVVAAPAGGQWFYWFSWAEQIARLDDIGSAAARIEHVLSSDDDSWAGCGGVANGR